MDRTRLAAPRAARLTVTSIAVAASLGALAVFASGQVAADRLAAPAGAAAPRRTHAPPAEPAGPGAASAAGVEGPRSLAGAGDTLPAPAAPTGAPARPGRPTPALVAQVTEAARLGLEAARADLVARCLPAGRAGPGAPPVPFTFHVTFDAGGREIARGIGEDRRARAPEVAGCLRRLPLGTLRVDPPGTSVGVRVALSLP